MLSFCSNDPNIFAQQGDLQQGDEDDDQLLPGELDSGRPHGHCLGAFSQVDNILEFSATIFRGDILFTGEQYPRFFTYIFRHASINSIYPRQSLGWS